MQHFLLARWLTKNPHIIRLFQNSYFWVPNKSNQTPQNRCVWCNQVMSTDPSTAWNPTVLVKQQLGLQASNSTILQSSFEQFKNNMPCRLYQIRQSGTEVKTAYVQTLPARDPQSCPYFQRSCKKWKVQSNFLYQFLLCCTYFIFTTSRCSDKHNFSGNFFQNKNKKDVQNQCAVLTIHHFFSLFSFNTAVGKSKTSRRLLWDLTTLWDKLCRTNTFHLRIST